MINDVADIYRQFMVNEKIDYLLVNSTNKFLVEYNSLQENSRYHLTNFSGSTGDVLMSMKEIFLFVDGRYHIQADLEVDHDYITVVKLQTGQKFLDEMIDKIPKDAVLGVFAQKNSQKTVEYIENRVKTKLLPYAVFLIFRASLYSALSIITDWKSILTKAFPLGSGILVRSMSLYPAPFIFDERVFSSIC